MAIVVLAGTLDTKGVEYNYVKECIESTGCKVILVDTGILENPPIKPDITAEQVMECGGTRPDEIRFSKEGSDTRAVAIETMGRCLTQCLKKLIAEKKCDAVFGMGGSGGTNLLSEAFKELPLGLPKMIVSTMMSGDIKPYVGGSDMTMMYSVTDIAGLNSFSRLILANAAHAIAGMANYRSLAVTKSEGKKKPLIAITMFGVTTPGVLHIRDILESKGFESIIFHATGAGGMAMENMVREGFISGVIDYTTSELTDFEYGGAFSAGPDRLTAAGAKGIPQVVVPGGLEILNYNGLDHLPKEKNVPERKLIIHNSTVCAVKTTTEELQNLGRILAEKVNRSTAPAVIMLPLGGLDKYEDGPWKDPEEDRALFDAIEEKAAVPVIEQKGTINEPEFSEAVANKFMELWNETKHYPFGEEEM